MDKRLTQLQTWLNETLSEPIVLTPVVGDASFRRYFRFQYHDQSFVAMDSPPDKEDCRPFIAIAQSFCMAGLHTPKIHAADADNGFLIISDFGGQLYYDQLTANNVDLLYQLAIDEIPKIQSCKTIENYSLPLFNKTFLLDELTHFTHWFLRNYLNFSLNHTRETLLEKTYAVLIKNAASQPQVTTHRDYHSRNLMLLPDHQIGILDFQDAVIGPVTYDLVSLIRDCYVDWPPEKVTHWALDFRQQLLDDKRINYVDEETFLAWFDLIGLQRHLKATFIFARKQLRDDNDFYLQFIPRALNYAKQVARRYNVLNDFYCYLNEEVIPSYLAISPPPFILRDV